MAEQKKSYEDMTIEELKEQLEKEKLIREISELKQVNNGNPAPALNKSSVDEQEKKKRREDAFIQVMKDRYPTEDVEKLVLEREPKLNPEALERVKLKSQEYINSQKKLKEIIEESKRLESEAAARESDATFEFKKSGKKLHRGFCCPKCGSTNISIIDNAVGGTKTTLNLNPLHPFTVVKTEKKGKKVRSKGKTIAAVATGGLSLLVTGGTKKRVTEEWYCHECGHRWYRK